MTGRELIMYILENHLEDEPVFSDGTFIGFVSDLKFAEMLGVGLATVHVWNAMGCIEGAITIGNNLHIPIKYATQVKNSKIETQGSDCACKIN